MRELPMWLRGLSYSRWKDDKLCALRDGNRKLYTRAGISPLQGLRVWRWRSSRPRFSVRVASYVDANQWGIAPLLTRVPILRVVIAVVLLDYGLYVWHVLTHRISFLWRFHLVHHIDLDLDTSTAIRFHFGEMLLSVPWRLAQACVAGASPIAVSVWQTQRLLLLTRCPVHLPFAGETIAFGDIRQPNLGLENRTGRRCDRAATSLDPDHFELCMFSETEPVGDFQILLPILGLGPAPVFYQEPTAVNPLGRLATRF